MTGTRLTQRGAYAVTPARLPALQSVRANSSTQELARAIEALREWVEVRLGSRGDAYERAVTMRDFDQVVTPLTKAVAELKGFDGTIGTLRSEVLKALPAPAPGAFAQVGEELYFCPSTRWRKVTLTDP